MTTRMKIPLAVVIFCSALIFAEQPAVQTSVECDWPEAYPLKEPFDKRMKDTSPQELIPMILGEKAIPTAEYEHDDVRVACMWFIWKTRLLKADEGQKLRRELAQKICLLLQKEDISLHDHAYLAGLLGPLEAHDELLVLLGKIDGIDCCYGPHLLFGLAECGDLRDVPLLIPQIGKEREVCAGVFEEMLQLLTNITPPKAKQDQPRTDAAKTDAKQWKKWWTWRPEKEFLSREEAVKAALKNLSIDADTKLLEAEYHKEITVAGLEKPLQHVWGFKGVKRAQAMGAGQKKADAITLGFIDAKTGQWILVTSERK